jgi:site-specific DNA recombinase
MEGAVLYARVSTADQAKQRYNIPAQLAKLREFCSQSGMKVVKIFVDRGESARTTDRRQFQAMMSFCRENRKIISHVVVADLSRLARDVIDQGTTIATLKQLGITTTSVDEPFTDDTAAGKLARNMLGSFNQFFSDSLSERIRYRMKVGFDAGRFLHYAPLGYKNVEKNLAVDRERAPLVRKAFEMIASGSYATGDAVLKRITALGLVTRRGRPLTKQSFAGMLQNPIYAGWIVSEENRVRGNHEAIVSNDLFQAVQDRLNGKSSPHKRLSEEFPLRGFVRCAKCGKNLTAGYVKGRKERYPRYWCWQKACHAVGISRDELEQHWVTLLSMMQPTMELLAMLPELAARQWEARKTRIATEARTLKNRQADQQTLNRKAIEAKLKGDLSPEDFAVLKNSLTEEAYRINAEINALDSERSTMEDLIRQARAQLVDLVTAWKTGNVNQRQELSKGLFPEGLVFSHELKFFEPANVPITQMASRFLENLDTMETPISPVGAGDGI